MNHAQVMAKYRKQLTEIAQQSILASASKVPERTRKYSGQARASTNLAIGSPDTSTVLVTNYHQNAIRGTRDLAKQRFARVAKDIKLGDQVFVTNSLPYIRMVEFKYGDRMFGRTQAEWSQDVSKAINDSR